MTLVGNKRPKIGAINYEMKHQIVHTLQKYLLNPPIKVALAAGLPLPGYALLETKGRKTGKSRRTPVGDGRIGKPVLASGGTWDEGGIRPQH